MATVVRRIPFTVVVVWLCGIVDISVLVLAPHVGIPIATLLVGYAVGRQVSFWRWTGTGKLP